MLCPKVFLCTLVLDDAQRRRRRKAAHALGLKLGECVDVDGFDFDDRGLGTAGKVEYSLVVFEVSDLKSAHAPSTGCFGVGVEGAHAHVHAQGFSEEHFAQLSAAQQGDLKVGVGEG